MTEKQLMQVKEQLKERGLLFVKAYRAFEGGIRVVGTYEASHGREFRYEVNFEGEYPRLKEMF